eukprot:gnl/TRDRNA2_/TRDRNA2_190416_c0_seq1.p1 gnl/TRDRNA2_/TRDRNA2_190416_c0~~gnl/TRDRNA2_/TRDRNA2_190416_c0_seq1.p1  ORF type:complete len:628 (-),score=180.19 gnl/TRDRNA2_/TRDRNA2_190416_c0_seq1:56-1939(-)
MTSPRKPQAGQRSVFRAADYQVEEPVMVKKNLLNEMREVRQKMQVKRSTARVKGQYDLDSARRALSTAGQHAMSLQKEADLWQARATDYEENARASKAKQDQTLAKVEEANSFFVANAKEYSWARMDGGRKLTEETKVVYDKLHQHSMQQSETWERYNERLAQLKTAAAAAWDPTKQVRSAVERSARVQLAGLTDVMRSREASQAAVKAAERDYAEQRAQCEAAIQRERICSHQGRTIAKALRKQEEVECEARLERAEARIEFVETHAARHVADFEEEMQATLKRNEAWVTRGEKAKAAAEERRKEDAVEASVRVDKAKVLLANLQAYCAGYLRELNDKWEEAKKVDAKREEVAALQTEELEAYCRDTLQCCEKYCAETLAKAEETAREKKAKLEERIAMLEALSKQRVEMMVTQSRDRREKAEKQLASATAHVEEVRLQCEERKRIETETANEKVRLVRERVTAEVARAELRTREAAARRAEAQAAWNFAMARCAGSAAEARRRGLADTAAAIEKPPAPPAPAKVQAPAAGPPELGGQDFTASELAALEAAYSMPANDIPEDALAQLGDDVGMFVGERPAWSAGTVGSLEAGVKDEFMATASTMLPDESSPLRDVQTASSATSAVA